MNYDTEIPLRRYSDYLIIRPRRFNTQMNMRPVIAVVIVNWNTKEMTSSCIQSILPYVVLHRGLIIVVDNNSSDGSVEHFSNKFEGNKSVTILANNENCGFARANNQAIRSFNADYFLLLNSDTFIKNDPLTICIEYLKCHPDVGLIGCKLLNADGSLQRSCSNFPRLFTPIIGRQFVARRLRAFAPGLALRYTSALFDEDHEHIQFPDWVMGAFLFLRGELAKKIDGLDEQYFMYMEDMDLCYKIRMAGYKTAFLPTCAITHFGGTSSKIVPKKKIMREIASNFIFFCKSRSGLTGRLYIVIEILSQTLELFVMNILKLEPRKVSGHTVSQTRFKLRCYIKALFLPSDKLKRWGI